MFLIPHGWYVIKKTKKKGRGAFAARDIATGTVIGDYLGTIMPRDASDERKNGLYDMAGGLKYEILANPNKDGIHLINHSCAPNCETYPYEGHILYFAIRKIFQSEELTVNYALYAPEENIPCRAHACYCGSKFCRGTMHDDWNNSNAWESLLKKNFGQWYRKVPGKYGSKLPPLRKYPNTVKKDFPKLYGIFGAEKKPPAVCRDSILPSASELRKRIRETGRRLAFPRLHLIIYGMRNDILAAEVDENQF